MSDVFQTTCVLYMTDVRDGEPTSGTRVLALTEGGRTVEITWTGESYKHYLAWCPFPKIQQKTKDRLLSQYLPK